MPRPASRARSTWIEASASTRSPIDSDDVSNDTLSKWKTCGLIEVFVQFLSVYLIMNHVGLSRGTEDIFVVRHLFLIANIVTTSKALVTTSDALVTSSFCFSMVPICFSNL